MQETIYFLFGGILVVMLWDNVYRANKGGKNVR